MRLPVEQMLLCIKAAGHPSRCYGQGMRPALGCVFDRSQRMKICNKVEAAIGRLFRSSNSRNNRA